MLIHHKAEVYQMIITSQKHCLSTANKTDTAGEGPEQTDLELPDPSYHYVTAALTLQYNTLKFNLMNQ